MAWNKELHDKFIDWMNTELGEVQDQIWEDDLKDEVEEIAVKRVAKYNLKFEVDMDEILDAVERHGKNLSKLSKDDEYTKSKGCIMVIVGSHLAYLIREKHVRNRK